MPNRRKTSDESPDMLEPQPHGGALKRGNTGNRGGGRQRETFLKECRKLALAAPTRRALAVILKDPTHKHWPLVAKLLFEHAFGRPQQFVDLTTHETANAEELRDRIAGKLDAIEQRLRLVSEIEKAPEALRRIAEEDHQHHYPS